MILYQISYFNFNLTYLLNFNFLYKMKWGYFNDKNYVFGTRDYEKDALNWGKEHNVEVVTSEEILSEDTDRLEGFDGVTTMQFGKLADSVYPKLEKYGIKQIAQRTAGFDMYDLDLAKHNIVISNVPSYSPETIAEYSVSIALQLVRKFLQLKTRSRT